MSILGAAPGGRPAALMNWIVRAFQSVTTSAAAGAATVRVPAAIRPQSARVYAVGRRLMCLLLDEAQACLREGIPGNTLKDYRPERCWMYGRSSSGCSRRYARRR